ncbi:TPA: hypothetical protein QCY05_000857 [Bacillus wiedmannii]|nr:hypothetical protein [Bacillus wiedmannii]
MGKLPNPIGIGKYKDELETTLYYKFTNDGKPDSPYVFQSVKVEGNEYKVTIDKSVNKILVRNGHEPMTKGEILLNAKYIKQIILLWK